MARAMKDSGIEWIGEIPVGWKISRIKYVADFEPKCDFSNLLADDIITYTPMENIKNGYYIPNTAPLGTLSTSLTAYQNNDIVMAKVTPCFENGNIAVMNGLSSGVGLGSSELFVFRAKEMQTRYLFYWLQNKAFVEQAKSTMTGTGGLKRVSPQFVRDCAIHCPPLDEQVRISVFLDAERAQIDAVIEQTRASIEEYKKLKQSIITQAVTKGIRPGRRMKDSGVEWIGEIPEEWNICKLRHIGSTQNGISKGGEYFGEGYPFVSYGDVYRNFSLPHTVRGLIRSTEEERALYSVLRGDIFFTRTSETIEEVGFSSVCETTIPNATFAGFLIRVRPYDDTLDVGYSKYYFRSNHHRFYLVKQMNLVTRASLGQPLLKGMPVLVPGKEEQREIARYLDQRCGDIDNLILSKEKVIAELESYKKSLIFEYVTGKKEVQYE